MEHQNQLEPQEAKKTLGESFTCPRCGMVSHNPSDIRYLYCGNCHQYVVDIPFQWLWDETQRGNKDAEAAMIRRQEDYWKQREDLEGMVSMLTYRLLKAEQFLRRYQSRFAGVQDASDTLWTETEHFLTRKKDQHDGQIHT